MEQLKTVSDLPKPLEIIARSFLEGGEDYTPEIFHCVPDDLKKLMDEDDLVFQIILDKQYEKYYLVAVGESDRAYQSQLVMHNPIHTKRASMYFSEVSGPWIYAERQNFENRQMYDADVEYDGDESFIIPEKYQH